MEIIMSVYAIAFVSWEFSFASMIDHHLFLLILALLTLAFSLLLRSTIVFAAQISLLTLFYMIESSWASPAHVIAAASQGLLSILAVVGYVKAVNYNYHLIMEKIHRIPSVITMHGSLGMRHSFLMMHDLFKKKKK